ncbi:MAG: N-acetyl-gamma-glutamyl-phosphate reductase [Alphaproteobacteria bacterium]
MGRSSNVVQVGVIGASGYTGAELVRLLAPHPKVALRLLTADRNAGQPLGAVFPHLAGLDLPHLTRLEDSDLAPLDAVFCCLPHGATQEVIAGMPRSLKIIDLSADFRLADPTAYETWYGHPHRAPRLQAEAVYGLTELARDAVRKARLVANPGCYPTSAQLPLVPLLDSGAIAADDIVIDAKSGVSGAGRQAKEANLFPEVSEGIQAYGVAAHRHAPEIEQGLSRAAGRQVIVTFTPHLVPMNRGILSSIYVKLAGKTTADDIRDALAKRYADEPFVRVLPKGAVPATHHVRGSNLCLMAVFADRVPGRAIILSVIDNLVKGASGQAVQNMNLMFGIAETTALEQEPLFP